MSKLPTLLQISSDLDEAIKTIQSMDGEITSEIEERLSALLIAEKQKVSGYSLVLTRYDNEIDFIKKQIEEAKAYVAKLENQQDRLISIAQKVIESRGGVKLEGENGHWIGTRKSTSVKIEDQLQIPEYYLKLEPKVDKALIKEDLSKGVAVPGASLEHKLNITWK